MDSQLLVENFYNNLRNTSLNSSGKEVKIAILSRAFIVLPGPVLTSVVFGTSCGLFALALATVVTVLWCKQDITKMEQ